LTTADDSAEWLARGEAQRKAGRPVDAMLAYRRALRSKEHAVQAHFHLGELLHDVGRDAEAFAAWRAALTQQPEHVPSLLAFAAAMRRSGDFAEAARACRRVLACEPQHVGARVELALAKLPQGDAAAYSELATLLRDDANVECLEEVARCLAVAPWSPARHMLLVALDATRRVNLPPLLLAIAAQDAAEASEPERARLLLDRASEPAPAMEDPEALRRLALSAATIGAESSWAERYAEGCAQAFAPAVPWLWPRRAAGDALRVAYLLAPGHTLRIGHIEVEPRAYIRSIVAAHSHAQIAAAVWIVDGATLDEETTAVLGGLPVATLGHAPAPGLARLLAEADYDVLIDLAGTVSATGPLLAQRPARTTWTYAELVGAHARPLVTHLLPALMGARTAALSAHRQALEAKLIDACVTASWFTERAGLSPAALAQLWRAAVQAHQGHEEQSAVRRYRELLEQEPGSAPVHYLFGVLLRDQDQPAEAEKEFAAAVAAAPTYAEARAALAALLQAQGRFDAAVAACRDGVVLAPQDAALWRSLGLTQLARHDGAAATEALERALELSPAHAETHYNHGVALQMQNRRDEALRAYRRALMLDPAQIGANFNRGVIFHEQGRTNAAIATFEQVIARDPRHQQAHQALGVALLGARRIDDWLKAFRRFEANCPNALPLALQALEACQYSGDFAALDRYLERLRQGEFKATNDIELADCLEELLYLLLFFDIEPEMHFGFYRAYNAVAQRVYGMPLALAAERQPGRLRVAYVSGDLRNHVMGKMMWEAVRHHDRSRFELFFYSLSAESDRWSERYRDLADHFHVFAELSDRQAAERILADDIDVLVDLATNTRGSKPGILALKPARVQITHVASAGVLGLSSVDFKLTDGYADVPENQAFQLETLLPMDGCVYPYRHVAPAVTDSLQRERLGIAADAIAIGAFVNPLKLSRRCLALWREILERVPRALLALSPMTLQARGIFVRLLTSAGIDLQRVVVVPQGRNDAENQARYHIVDFTLDPMPFGGVNGTLESLDMGVPVVTLRGRKHSERTSYSILANLGVTQTVADSAAEYVEIAVRLATDSPFMREVRASIQAGLASSPLVDMPAHTRNLEQAYLKALELRYPTAVAAALND